MPAALFISHGSPMLALDSGESGSALAKLAKRLTRPKAIIVLSAHWASSDLRISNATNPGISHEFVGFPDQLYQVSYPAPGSPSLARNIQDRLNAHSLPSVLDNDHPLDHGVWVPLILMYPEADIPVVQISIPHHCGPAFLTRLGQILGDLRSHGHLLIGSGSITHNLHELNWFESGKIDGWALEFRDWMVKNMHERELLNLINYRRLAPHALRNHPSEEHLLPLFFALGAGKQMRIEHTGFSQGSLGMDVYGFY